MLLPDKSLSGEEKKKQKNSVERGELPTLWAGHGEIIP